MTAKDKAKELFDKYCHAIRTDEDDDGYFTNIIHAKRCALLAVDEILEIDCFDMSEKNFENHIQYFEEVKNELEKL